MFKVNGHSVREVYQGMTAYFVDEQYLYFHVGQLANFLGVDVEDLRKAGVI